MLHKVRFTGSLRHLCLELGYVVFFLLLISNRDNSNFALDVEPNLCVVAYFELSKSLVVVECLVVQLKSLLLSWDVLLVEDFLLQVANCNLLV
jgi:hypothetical protein